MKNEDKKDQGADATAVDAVSCSVPADQRPHVAPEKLVRLTREDDYEKRWIVVGKLGAIDFHCSHADTARRLGVWRVGGVEYHYRAPAPYMSADYSCTHDHCWVLGGKCWHDGTSLWASEHWIPMLEACGEAWVWRELEATYRQHEWTVVATEDLTEGEASGSVPSAAQKS